MPIVMRQIGFFLADVADVDIDTEEVGSKGVINLQLSPVCAGLYVVRFVEEGKSNRNRERENHDDDAILRFDQVFVGKPVSSHPSHCLSGT